VEQVVALPLHPVVFQSGPVRVGFHGPLAIGAFDAGELEIVEEFARDAELRPKNDLAGAKEFLFSGNWFHGVHRAPWRLVKKEGRPFSVRGVGERRGFSSAGPRKKNTLPC
jgi:hypothetical protein